MLRNIYKIFVFVIILFVLFALLDEESEAQTTQLSPLEWAEKMVANVKPENTDYEHKRGTVKWKGIDGATEYESRTDCSGLLNALLERTYNLKPDDFESWLGVRRPLAITYHDAILNEQGFTRIESVLGVNPGDIIAIKYPPDSDNSGHIMLVAEKPTERTPTSPIIKGTRQWDVTVIDSSESGHGKTDTRRLPEGGFGQGVGRGVFRIYTDNKNIIAGYSWSDFANSEYHDQTDRHLVVGRLKKRFTKSES